MDISNMKEVDPDKIDRASLKQRIDARIDPLAPRQERIAQLASCINPYCYLDGGTVVITRFKRTGPTIDDCYRAYLGGL